MSNTLQSFDVISLQGAFQSALDTPPQSFAVTCSEPIRNTAEYVDLIDYISTGPATKTTGSRPIQRAAGKELLLKNERYTAGFSIPVSKWTSDSIGVWAQKASELGHQSVLDWDDMAIAMINKNSNKTLNAVNLFNSNNSVTGATASTLTVEQAAAAINKLVAKVKTRSVNGGSPRNQSMKQVIILTGNEDLVGILSAAVTQNHLSGGQTNPLSGLGLTIQVIGDARLTDPKGAYLLRADNSGPKPLFLTEQYFTEEHMGDGSDFTILNGEYYYGYTSSRACGGGDDIACGKINFA